MKISSVKKLVHVVWEKPVHSEMFSEMHSNYTPWTSTFFWAINMYNGNDVYVVCGVLLCAAYHVMCL